MSSQPTGDQKELQDEIANVLATIRASRARAIAEYAASLKNNKTKPADMGDPQLFDKKDLP